MTNITGLTAEALRTTEPTNKKVQLMQQEQTSRLNKWISVNTCISY